ncbi:MAG: tRNA lysidine(34) synthetase TilS, partial [Clostridia bacterium]
MEKRLFLKRISDTIEEYKMMPHGATVICGVSGGADSVAMLLALSELSVHVCAAHLNHAMRGDESDRDEAFVRALCDRKCIELYTERLAIPPESEDAARHARYSFFERAAAACGADKIATAHNANDSLETMIFNILRGTGLAGISGIPPVRDNIIRPLTEVARADIVEYLNDIGQDWVVDSTNVDVRYSRNLIRKEIIPCMEEINPRAVANSARAARML